MTSRVWYGVAIVVFLAAAGSAGWMLWHGLGNLGAGIVRVVIPGVATLNLDQEGSYTIFHESRSIVDGIVYASDDVNGLVVTITAEVGGKPVAVSKPTATSRYSISGHEGVSILGFAITEPGRYRLTAAFDDARRHDKTVLAIEHGFVARLLGTILTTVGTALAGVIAAVVIAAVTFAKRRRLARRPPTSPSGPVTRYS